MLTELVNQIRGKREQPTLTQQLQTGGGLCAKDAAPVFDVSPIDSEPGLVDRMKQLAWAKSRAQTVAAQLKQGVALLRETAAAESQVTVAEQQMSIDQLVDGLEEQIEAYCECFKAQLFADSKTYRCSAGEIQDRKRPLSIELDDEDAFVEAMRTSEAFQHVLHMLALVDGFDPFFRIELKIDKEGIKRALKDGQLKPDHLPAGISARGLTKDDTSIVIKPHEYKQKNVA